MKVNIDKTPRAAENSDSMIDQQDFLSKQRSKKTQVITNQCFGNATRYVLATAVPLVGRNGNVTQKRFFIIFKLLVKMNPVRQMKCVRHGLTVFQH